jgi:hypothetical protein
MFAAVGNREQALEHLRKAVDLLGRAVLPLTYDSVFAALRDLPEFQVIVSKAAEVDAPSGESGKPKPTTSTSPSAEKTK